MTKEKIYVLIHLLTDDTAQHILVAYRRKIDADYTAELMRKTGVSIFIEEIDLISGSQGLAELFPSPLDSERKRIKDIYDELNKQKIEPMIPKWPPAGDPWPNNPRITYLCGDNGPEAPPSFTATSMS